MLLAGALGATDAVAANQAPVAEAGLDQTVERNATVYLDAGGSRDPDGSIESFEWSVTAPNGTAVAPRCVDCERTSFRARQAGTYDVTVTVTDDDGASRSDTLYVRVETSDPPDVRLSGPETVTVGESVEFTAAVDSGADRPTSIGWVVAGSETATQSIDGPGTYERTVSFSDTGRQTVRVQVNDALGRTGTATHGVIVRPRATGNGASPDAPAGGGSDLSREGEPGLYFNNQGEVVDVRYGGEARAQDMVFRLGGATISGSRIERQLADGEVNYPTLLALTRSLGVGLPGSTTRCFTDGRLALTIRAGSAVSAGVDSECSTPTGW